MTSHTKSHFLLKDVSWNFVWDKQVCFRGVFAPNYGSDPIPFCHDFAVILLLSSITRSFLFPAFHSFNQKPRLFWDAFSSATLQQEKIRWTPEAFGVFQPKIPFHSQDILLPGNFSELASASPFEQSWRWNWIPQQPVNLWIYGYLGFENKQQIHTNTLWAFCGIGFIRFNGQLWKTPSWKPKGRVRNVKNHIRVVVAPGSPFSA